MPDVLLKLLGCKFTQVDTAAKHALGIEVDCDDGTRRKYIRAGAAIAANDALKVDVAEGAYDLDPTSAAAQPIAGVATHAIADNSFSWVIVRGKATVKVAATIVAGAHLVSTGTAGTLDDVAAAAADAQAAAAGIGVTAVVDDVPSAGLATVVLS
jgi:hypothetical protein